MSLLSLLLLTVLRQGAFVVEASGSTEYAVDVSRAALREYVDDVGLLSRNMPGVTAIESLGDGEFLYHTRKDLPLASPLVTTFRIRKTMEGDSVAHYRSVDPDAENFMSCTVSMRAEGEHRTVLGISIALRLIRENPSDVHWLAPVFGEAFISDRMQGDLEEMLKDFVRNSTDEMHRLFIPARGGAADAR